MSDYEPKCKKTLPIIFDDRMPASNLTPKLVGRVNDNTEDLKNLYEETETIQGDIDSLQESENLTAGNAEQLLTDKGVTDKVPYLLRASGGNGADREEDKIVGGTVAWNQLATAITSSGGAWGSEANVTATITDGLAVFTSSNNGYGIRGICVAPIPGHKYIISAVMKAASSCTVRFIYGNTGGTSGDVLLGTSFAQASCMVTATQTASGNRVSVVALQSGGSVNVEISVKDFCIFDLTQMFGTAIADRAYALEQATAGSGIAWLKSMGFFQKDYYPYDAGTLKSVEGLTAHSMVGFNQLSNVANYYGSVHFSYSDGTLTNILADANANGFGLSLQLFYKAEGTTSPNVFVRSISFRNRSTATGVRMQKFSLEYGETQPNYYLRVKHNGATIDLIMMHVPTETLLPNVTYCISMNIKSANAQTVGGLVIDNICINRSSSRNGEYKPYVKHSYPLDSTLTLRGIPKLDANNQLYYDGDEYAADGTVTRKYGIVTYDGSSDENWVLEASGNAYIACSEAMRLNDYRLDMRSNIEVVANPGYLGESSRPQVTGYTGSASYPGQNWIYIKTNSSSVTDKTTLRAWLASNPVTVVFKLATSTIEEAEPFQNPQIVDDFGTEEYETTGIVPVGHDTFYPENLRKKIEDAPSSPTADGDYILRRTSGVNTYATAPGMDVVTVSGTTVTQTGEANKFYVCGTLATLTFTAPSSGICGIRFTSGSTATVLTVSGVSYWMNGFNPSSLEANKTYEISILNGVGVVGC